MLQIVGIRTYYMDEISDKLSPLTFHLIFFSA